MNNIDDLIEDVTEVTEGVISASKRQLLTVGGVLSGVFGFIADVLQPVAPFAIYLFITSVIVLLVSAVCFFKFKKGFASMVLFGASAVVFGAITLFQHISHSKDNGAIAKMVPAVSDFQKVLGIVEEKLDGIKEDTKELKATTGQIAKDTSETKTAVRDLNYAVRYLKTDGIIKNAESAEDFYHNAKIYELSGDYSNARKAYTSYIKFKTNKLDPHLSLTDFLRSNDSISVAREDYKIITRGIDTPVVVYTKILLRSPNARREALIAFQQEHPDFAPVYYHLSWEYSEEKLGEQQFSDIREEYKWLRVFDKLDQAGKVSTFFIDKERLSEWKNDVAARLRVAEVKQDQLAEPVSIIEWVPVNMPRFDISNTVIIGGSSRDKSGVIGTLTVLEDALEIEVKFEGEDAFSSLGFSDEMNPKTRQKEPKYSIVIPHQKLKAQMIDVRYKDATGKWSDTYQVSIEKEHIYSSYTNEKGEVVINPSMQDHIMNHQAKWIEFREFDGRLLIYITNLMKCRSVMKSIHYSLDKKDLDLKWKIDDIDFLGKAPLSDKNGDDLVEIYRSIPKTTQMIYMQIIFKDGAKSEIVEFANPYK